MEVTDLDQPLKFKAGKHDLEVKGKDFETVSKSFTVKRGTNPVLRVELTPVIRTAAAPPMTENVAAPAQTALDKKSAASGTVGDRNRQESGAPSESSVSAKASVDDPAAATAPNSSQAPPTIASSIRALAPNRSAVSKESVESRDNALPKIELGLTGRGGGMKKALLVAYGGDKTTEDAVRAGLGWLKKNQLPDGSWSLLGPFDHGGVSVDNKVAATAMALLAFQGAGQTHREGDYKREVRRGWDALLRMQNAEGFFEGESNIGHRMYAQAQASIAVCEIYGMTKDPKFKEPAQLALDFAHKAQSPEGGWRYAPKVDSDTSVTGWFVMALQSGKMAGLNVESETLDKISQFLDTVAHRAGSQYTYHPGGQATPAMTAEALLCRQYLGWTHDDSRLRAGIEHLLENPINYGDKNAYYWYYATQACHHMDGDAWDRWNQVMRQAVPEQQVKTGFERGSWSADKDRWGVNGGRLYTTCLSICMLEVYYRHLPVYTNRVQ